MLKFMDLHSHHLHPTWLILGAFLYNWTISNPIIVYFQNLLVLKGRCVSFDCYLPRLIYKKKYY